MDERSLKRAVTFDIEKQEGEEDPASPPSSSSQYIDKRVSFGDEGSDIHKRVSFGNDHQFIKQVSFGDEGNDQVDQEQSEQHHGRDERQQQQQDHGFDQEYDPYLGLGLRNRPDIPMLLVFNLMESRRFTNFSSPLREKLFYVGAFMGGGLFAAALVLCLVMFGFQLRERPQLPIIKIKYVAIAVSALYRVPPETIQQQQFENKGNYYGYGLNFQAVLPMEIKNPNRHLDIHHHSIDITVFYQGTPLAVDRIYDIPHPRGDTIMPYFAAYARGRQLPLSVGYTLEHQFMTTGPTRLVVEIIFHSQITLLKGFRALAFAWRCQCNAYGQRNCRCLDAKWEPKHNLPYYREWYWPTDYESYLAAEDAKRRNRYYYYGYGYSNPNVSNPNTTTQDLD